MSELFSCRNCIHNCGQSLLIGKGEGFCIKHDTVLLRPERSTCKYLHRKDLPRFVVDEGLREHAGEFSAFSAVVDLLEHKPVERVPYSEKFSWERRRFDPVTQSLAQYRKVSPAWVFLQAMTGGVDGRRALAHASLVRRYMDRCSTWKSSYRFVLAIVQALPDEPQFADGDLNSEGDVADGEIRQEAAWDVFFTRLSGIQEYGFHAGIESLMWAGDQLNGALTELDWTGLKPELMRKSAVWTDLIVDHANSEGAFFPAVAAAPAGSEDAESP